MVLVTGAAGLIGSHLCEAFARAGWEVRALDRPESNLSVAQAAGAKPIFAELSRPEGSLAAAESARGAQLVAHAAFPGAAERDEALAGVRGAMGAARQARGPLLPLSSPTLYRRPPNLPFEAGEG